MGMGFFSGRFHCDECGAYTDTEKGGRTNQHAQFPGLCVKCGEKLIKDMNKPAK